MTEITVAELAGLSGELLPERAVMSLVNLNVNVLNSRTSNTYMLPNSDRSVAYACQATNSSGPSGLLGVLGLGSADSTSTLTCIPSAITG